MLDPAGGGNVADPGVHPGERESYRILRSRIDLSRLPPISRAVTERVICATADFDYATDLVRVEPALAAAVAALASGAPMVADAAMVATGIIERPVICKADDPLTIRLARVTGISRPAAAVRLAFSEVCPGAVWVVGCAQDALAEIMQRGTEPALVIGVPAGLDGAAEVKAALRASGLPSLTNTSPKGGAAVAAAAASALLRLAAVAAGSVPAGPPQVIQDNPDSER
ncbi:MAG TPA: precorrin-8X methylmutase [Streptosporangiaceae bacterium]